MRQPFITIFGIVAILLCVGLSGCNDVNHTTKTEQNKFIGKWENRTLSFEIFSNGTFRTNNNQSGAWCVNGSIFVMNYSAADTVYTYYYVFSNNDRTLTLRYTKYQMVTIKLFKQ